MSRTVYALMVGIDAYRPPVAPLRGCVNDIQSLHALLTERLSGSGMTFELLMLIDAQATRQAVIDGFTKHLCRAGPDDVALFCYAGHGSQQRTAPEFWHLEPDRLDETLVCFDSREPDQYDLADKELAKLIAQVAQRNPHILVILDSCHSGSGTRDMSTTGVRRAATDMRERPLSTYLVMPAEAEQLDAGMRSVNAAGRWIMAPKGRHVVMSACQDNEEAREVRIGETMRGVFSHFLLDTLQTATPDWTYRDLFKRVNALVRTRVAAQSPLIQATDLADLDRPFLGGAIVEQALYYTASFHKSDGWVIDAGAMHGIPSAFGDETTIFALFPIGAVDLDHLDAAVGEAAVTEAMPTRSKLRIRLAGGAEPDPGLTYKAVLTALPLAPLTVRIEGDAAGAQRVREALARAGAGGPSLLVCETTTDGDMRLKIGDGRMRIMRAADSRPLFLDIDGVNAATARQAVDRLEHIARWTRISALANPATRLSANSIRLEAYRVYSDGAMEPDPVDAATLASGLRFDYQFRGGEWIAPQFRIKLVNTTSRRLFCMLLDLTETFMVSPNLLPGGGIWLDRDEEAWALDGDAIDASIPDTLWEQGMGEIRDLIKLIVSTEEADATLLAQDELDMAYEPRQASRSGMRASTLDRLMQRVQTRHLGARPKPQDKLADWTSSEITITTARPLKSLPVPAAGQSAALSETVTLHGHATLKAIARLTTLPQAARSADAVLLPPILLDDPAVAMPFEFSASRDGEPGLSVLELVVDSADAHELVTRDAPLVVTINIPLAEGEHVLAIGHDGEFHLPLGRAHRVGGGVEVTLERLPKPVNTRSLTSAVRILFEKIVTETFGWEGRYPLLAVVEGEGLRSADLEYVRSRVAEAQRIVVYIHGIIGDTIGMARSAYATLPNTPQSPLPALADSYDLVLAFDYENLKTPIEQTARDFKHRLEQVGLAAGHGKTLHIVAHSMGGLISRWFIEREGGNAIVQHLVMLGTPNGGSPWSTVEDWATTALALGLNSLTNVAWPVQLLGGLVAAVEQVDESLDQMKPGSPFLASLAASADPGIPYTVLAGNTAIIRAALDEANVEKGGIARLLQRLSPQNLLHGATGLAFFYKPNDIAASVASICAIPAGRVPPAMMREVASDHLSYFSTEAGLHALADALR